MNNNLLWMLVPNSFKSKKNDLYLKHSPHLNLCWLRFWVGQVVSTLSQILPTSTFSQHSPHINFLTTFSPQLTCKDEIFGSGQRYQHSHNNLPTSTFTQHLPHINIFTTSSPHQHLHNIIPTVYLCWYSGTSCTQKMWVIYGAKINGTKLSW